MVIKRHNGPLEGLNIVHEEFRRRNHAAAFGAGFESHTPLSPLPLYSLGLNRILSRSRNYVADAKKTGWLYLVIGTSEAGNSKVRMLTLKDAPSELYHSSISHGRICQELLDACHFVDRKLNAHEYKYEPRVLTIPSLNKTFLWIYGKRSYFVVLGENQRTGKSDLHLLRSIKSLIDAAKYKRAPTNSLKNETPTN